MSHHVASGIVVPGETIGMLTCIVNGYLVVFLIFSVIGNADFDTVIRPDGEIVGICLFFCDEFIHCRFESLDHEVDKISVGSNFKAGLRIGRDMFIEDFEVGVPLQIIPFDGFFNAFAVKRQKHCKSTYQS